MKHVLARLLYVIAAVSAAAQPTIPVSNLSPVTGPSVIGRETGTGRAQVIPLGAGLSFSGGALTAAGGGGGGAPVNATYITQTPNATLTNEQALSALSSGLMFVTTTTGAITSLGTTLPAANGGFGVNVSGSSGVPLFSAGVPTFTGTSGTGVFARVGAPTFTGNVTMSGNLAVAGNITVGNMTTTNLTITGSITGVMGAANGGTSQSTYTKGDIVVAAAATTLNKLAVGANGLVLTANSTATNGVSWDTASGGTVTASGPPSAGQAAMWTSATNLQGVTVTGTGAPVLGTSPAFTTNLTLPNAASPTTGAVAVTAFDTDAWAASRGAVQVHDGTANTFVVATLASDTPTNGQVPTWNTGGTVTWETGGGSGDMLLGTAQTVTAAKTFNAGTLKIASGGDLVDANGNELFKFTATASAVNEVTLANAAAGSGPTLAASGGDTDVRLNLAAKGAEYVTINSTLPGLIGRLAGNPKWIVSSATATNDVLTGSTTDDFAVVNFVNSKATLLGGSNASGQQRIVLSLLPPSGTTVNYTTLTAAASGSPPTISAAGSDTDIRLDLASKGSDYVTINCTLPGLFFRKSGTLKFGIAPANSAGDVIVGSATNEGCFVNYASVGFRFSVDTGSTTAVAISSAGQLSAEKTTASTSTTTGALISKGGLGVAGAIVAGGSATFSQTGGLIGTTTNNNADAGSVGQYIESLVASGSAVSLTTATPANVTSISLTAGDWDVSGIVNFTASAATVTATSAGISSTTDTLPTDGSEGYSGVQLVTASATDSVTMARKRMSLSGTTTVYLVASRTFSVGTSAAFGTINARRVR